MNKNELLKIFKPLLISSSLSDEINIKKASTNLEGTDKSCAIFYNLREGKKNEELFLSRLKKANPGLLILNRLPKKSIDSDYLLVEENLEGQKIISDYLYPFDQKIKVVGVTGTNGKTTTVNLAVQLCAQMGKRAFSIGTLGVFDLHGSIYEDINSTTPSYLELRKILNKFQDDYDAVFMEVSSHALVQSRLYDIKLDSAGWTSFSQDHLDYHKTIGDYFKAKASIGKILKDDKRLLVPDQEVELGKDLKDGGYSYQFVNSSYLKKEELPFSFWPDFNFNNLLLAYGLVTDIFGDFHFDYEEVFLPKGRFSLFEYGDVIFAIDYAHTPDALENICRSISESFKEHSLITVFGCGGDRDKAKRPLMAKAAEKFSDFVIVTTDNPRSERPEEIINDAIEGFFGDNFTSIVDRKEAIEGSLRYKSGKTIVLIAGKGHEEYQEIGGVKHPFSDFNVVKQLME